MRKTKDTHIIVKQCCVTRMTWEKKWRPRQRDLNNLNNKLRTYHLTLDGTNLLLVIIKSLSSHLDLSTLDPEVKFIWLVRTKPGMFHKPCTDCLPKGGLRHCSVCLGMVHRKCGEETNGLLCRTPVFHPHIYTETIMAAKRTLSESGKVKPLPKIRAVESIQAQVESIHQCRVAHNCSDLDECSPINDASGFFFFVRVLAVCKTTLCILPPTGLDWTMSIPNHPHTQCY